ncbi:MAG TPA: tetratricopeptide repeat protein [Chitinophagaceae bacterium]|jgi:tetratricopeptide (TPR) repeat protein
MKKNIIYISLLIVFVAAIAMIFYKYKSNNNNDPEIYSLLPRKGATAQANEWLKVKAQAYKLLEIIRNDPKDTRSLIQLATLYIQEARVTGNYAYYDRAALKYVNDALKINNTDFEATTLKSLIYLSQHHFADGLELAQKAKSINPYNAYVYGICVDGNVEMGNYKAAVEDADKMISIRPDIRSYARVSYLREIYGDYPGAIDAMKMAVDAGAPGDEATEWSRVQLGHLYENTGDMLNAEMHYTMAIQERPGYAYALAGLGRIAAAKKDYKKAIEYYRQADSSVTDFSIKEGLSDVYREMGETENSSSMEKKIIEEMNQEADSGNNDANIGHYVDKELAYAYLKINDYDNALRHALAEYDRRPDNIDVNECAAWVYYCRGDYEKAVFYIKAALKTNCKNPTLLYRAGLIYAKAGNKTLAKKTLVQALKMNANVAGNLKVEGKNILQTL